MSKFKGVWRECIEQVFCLISCRRFHQGMVQWAFRKEVWFWEYLRGLYKWEDNGN